MRVLWFSNTPASGGEYLNESAVGGGWMKSLDNALKDKVDLHVAFYYPKTSNPFLHNGIKYYPIGQKNWRYEAIKSRFITNFLLDEHLPKYLEIINLVKPDIIHIHGTENPFGCIINKISIPVVVSIQGILSVIQQQYFKGIEERYSNLKNWTSLKSFIFENTFKDSYRKIKKEASREIITLRASKNIIGRTAWDNRVTRVLSANSKYYINNELLRPAFYDQIWKPNFSEKCIIHTTSGNSLFKGFETICETLNLLNNLPLRVEWRVAGVKESDPIVKAVRAKLKANYPEKGLVLLGSIAEKELVTKMKEASLYVCPSHIENSPNSLCEAMIIGMPCIASFAGGIGSMINDGEDGLLIQDGDPWAMAGAILELVADRSKATNLGLKARNRALVRHERFTIVETLVDIYSTILSDANEH